MHSSNDPSDSANTDNASPKRSKPRRGRGRRKPPRGGGLALIIEFERLGICRLPAENRIPIWVHRSSFYTVSRSRDELSIVCEERLVPKSVDCEMGWRAIRVKEPLDPSLVGVLASLANPLTEAGVSIFSISTYDTDYLLVREKKLDRARQVLADAGHRFLDPEVELGDGERQDVEPQRAVPQDADDVSLPSMESKPVAPPAEDAPGEETKVRRRRRRRGPKAQEASPAVASPVKEPPSQVDEGTSAAAAVEDSEAGAAAILGEDAAEDERPRRRRRRRRSRGTGTAEDVSDAQGAKASSKDSGPAEAAAVDGVSNQATEAKSTVPDALEATPENDASQAATESAAQGEGSEGASATAETDTDGADPSESMLTQSTRRRSLRSADRLKRLSQALRQFGASLTSDPRFAGSSNATVETAAEEASASAASQHESASAESEEAASKEADSQADASQTTQSPAAAPRTEGDELDLDWESELVARAEPGDAESSGDSKAAAVTTETTVAETTAAEAIPIEAAAEAAVEVSAAEAKASKMAAFQGESLSLAAEEDDGDGEVDEDGLYTGAIPQGDVEVTDQSFATLGLSDEVLEAVRQMGFEHPTPIQAAVVPEALEGVDIIGLAETGSGKTAAFVLPLAERLYRGKGIRGLIICPTREIALQTKSFIDAFGRNHKLRAVAVIGGVKMGPQIDGLRSRPDILVATPGRLADHLRRGNVDLSRLEELVIDEADHMLDLGFLPQIKEILQQVPKERRSMMFSATMLPEIERLAQQFMNDPLTIDIRPVNRVAEGIEHRLYLVHDADLKTCLLRLLDEVQGSTLIFARRKLHTEWLARQLQQAGWPADRIHSDRTQAQRVRALRGFREGKFRILVATDVAARGIDVPRIQHVINYGMPESVSDYVHRAGRTARGNSVGVVSSIGTWQDKPTVREIESVLGTEIPRCELEGIEPYVERRPRRKTVRRRRLL